MKLLLSLLLYAACSSNCLSAETPSKSGVASAAQRAEVEKLRAEIMAAMDADSGEAGGAIVQPEWTRKGDNASSPHTHVPSKVIVNAAVLKETKALRSEIKEAVAKQGLSEAVRQLEAEVKSKSRHSQRQDAVGSAREDVMLGGIWQDDGNHANLVDAPPLDIDLAQLQQLELSKRRTREMLVLGRIEENLQFRHGTDVTEWFQLQQNGTIYIVGKREQELLLFQQQATATEATFPTYELLQTLPIPATIHAVHSFGHWNQTVQQQESLILLATEEGLLWLHLEAGVELTQFWQWPLGSLVNRLLHFAVDNHEYLALVSNQTLSIYAHDLDTLEFWIAQRMRLKEPITGIAVLDTGRDLLLAVGQTNEAIIFAHNMRGVGQDTVLQLQLHQHLEAPLIGDIAAFQMGGRSYLALSGERPQILAYIQGQLVPRTVLGQDFGVVELFLPVPTRSYRDDLLLLVQHRIHFEPHTLLQLSVLIWNGEAFEASLPAPCEVGPHVRYGASCMLDEMHDTGLRGATLLRQMQPPLLLVPRQSVPSGLFRLHTELLPRNSELHDIQDIESFMHGWVEDQDQLMQLAEQLLLAPPSEIYEEANTTDLINEGATVETLYVNDVLWTAEDTATDLAELLQEIRMLKQQILAETGDRRSKRQAPQLFHYDYEELEFDIVDVEELWIDKLNHVPFYIQNATLQLNGTINVQEMEVLEPQLTKSPEPLPSSTRQQLDLDGDLNCSTINGINWEEFVEQLVWRDQMLRLPQLHVEGAVVFEDSLHLSALNELNFPDDYLWSQSSSTSIIQGHKEFKQTLSVNAVDTPGSVNGCDPLDAITLRDAQDWPGLVTFTQLKVSEEFQVNGSVKGRQFEEAPPNPTLLESRHINAACHFTELIVNGPLEVLGLIDNSSFDALLGDLAQRPLDPNDELIIPGTKHVQEVSLPVDTHVLDGKLNDIPVELFVTKHSEQTLKQLDTLDGYVYFHKLQLMGSFDGVHLQQLLDQTLHVDAPLVAASTSLQFPNGLEVMEQLQVTGVLNDLSLTKDYQTLHEPLHLVQASAEHLQAMQLDVTHNVTGEGHLNGRPIDELLSTLPRTDHIQVQELILPLGVHAKRLQEINADKLLNFLGQLDELPLLILHGHLQVQQIAVSESVQVAATLNGRNLDQLQREVVWLDMPNDLRTRWHFQHSPVFASDMQLQGSYNQRLLPELLDDIVFRSDRSNQEVVIVGPKNFAGSVIVQDTLDLDALNGVPFGSFANKLSPLHFSGDLHLTGEFHANNVEVTGELNGLPIVHLSERLFWDHAQNAYVHRGLIQLPTMKLKELTVEGYLGNRSQEPLNEFFQNVIDKRQLQQTVIGHKIFTGRVSVRGGVNVTELNGIQLEDLFKQLIFLDGSDAITIHTPVEFKKTVRMSQLHLEQLTVPGEHINGCNITDWIRDTVRVDGDWRPDVPVAFADGALDNNAFVVEQLNQLNLSHLVTLHTIQNLSYPLLAQEIHLDEGHVWLDGLVNGYNLSEEFGNTLLTHAPYEQRVETPLVMQFAYVAGTLMATSYLNGDTNLNLSDVATTREKQLVLQTPLYFDQLHAPELHTQFHINGFDYSDWHEKSLWARGRPNQFINGNWSVYWLRVKQPHGSEQLPHSIYRRRAMEHELQLEEHYRKMCQRLIKLFGHLQLPYQVKHLRYSFELSQLPALADLRRAFAPKSAVKGVNYLLLNEQGCWTRIYRWNGSHYVSAGAFESGPIDDVAVLQLRNATNDQFTFMTSYELADDELESNWNCSRMHNLQSWRTTTQSVEVESLHISARTLEQLQQQHEAKQLRRRLPSYQHTIKYLSRPTVESQLHPHLDANDGIVGQAQYKASRERLLDHLWFRLQTEVNITQLSIPESDLYEDEQLVEDFIWLMGQLQRYTAKTGSQLFATLPTDTIPLPNTPARVLAARSAQLIWPVMEELRTLHARLPLNDSSSKEEQQEQKALELELQYSVHDVLHLANLDSTSSFGKPDEDEQMIRLHAVIERLQQLQQTLQHVQATNQQMEASQQYSTSLPVPSQFLQPVQTIRLYVGRAHHGRLLYARLTIMAPDAPPVAPSTGPPAHIQLHYANGTLFQSLAADHRSRQLTSLRVLDETLLAFVEGCCHVRVLIYRGIEGFVPFAEFRAKNDVLQLLAVRLPLRQMPGALYTLGVVHARGIVFYELVIPGLFESWLQCRDL